MYNRGMGTEGYEVEVESSVLKALRQLSRSMQERLVAAMGALGDDPRPHGSEKLTDVAGYRARVGDYRIVYRVDDAARVVTVTRVGHRSQVYRRR